MSPNIDRLNLASDATFKIAPSTALARCSRQEGADLTCDLLGMGFQSEMTRIEEPDDGLRHVALERLRADWQEEWIVLAPDSQERGLLCPEILLD